MPSANIEAIRTYIVLRGIYFPITSELWSGTTEILQRDMLVAQTCLGFHQLLAVLVALVSDGERDTFTFRHLHRILKFMAG